MLLKQQEPHKGDLVFPSPLSKSMGITKLLGWIGRSSPPPLIPQVWRDLWLAREGDPLNLSSRTMEERESLLASHI
jgi:hypothetical protein